ncbi:hypothetical protein [Saccharothrix syringae]|uniref:Uncharacterized protein n=1 Tax=Saccharothrix syringae TaxID=103733 RepID=A0A5Q0H9S2_SACSY|nr:hypothetical protein [Saccharothrix syringae]QFZ22560.1 hypothetical protein EKG83_38620 [Saccharothrix syringae]
MARRKRRPPKAAAKASANATTNTTINATTNAAPKPQPWFNRQRPLTQTGLIIGGMAAIIAGHFLLWGTVIPALGTLVGRVPVVSTAAGWLFGGGAFMAWGIVAVNHDTASPTTLKRLKTTAWSWTPIALVCIPTNYANEQVLPVDYWAGVYASAYGVVAAPLALAVIALLWWLVADKLLGHQGITKSQVGWLCVAYATLLLVWGSTLLRM